MVWKVAFGCFGTGVWSSMRCPGSEVLREHLHGRYIKPPLERMMRMKQRLDLLHSGRPYHSLPLKTLRPKEQFQHSGIQLNLGQSWDTCQIQAGPFQKDDPNPNRRCRNFPGSGTVERNEFIQPLSRWVHESKHLGEEKGVVVVGVVAERSRDNDAQMQGADG